MRSTTASQALFEQVPFPSKELAALGGTPMPEVIAPIQQVPREAHPPAGRPGNFAVARRGRRAVQQRQHRDFLPLFGELTGHFIGNIPAEAITTEVKRAV